MIFKRNNMAGKKTAHREIIKATDLDRLHGIVEGVIGRKCWKVTVNYGELCLHMGAHVSYENPKMAGEKKGAWILGTSGTSWILLTTKGAVNSADGEDEELERKAKVIENSRVTGFNVANNILLMDFSNKCKLLVVPTTSDAEYDLPYWELFMPNNMFIAFGPGNAWSYRRADVHVS